MRVVAEQQEDQATGLIPVEHVNALELFTGGGLDSLLKQVEQAATDFTPDITTASGRKEIASQAYKVARSKTTIDDAGKALVAEWKKKSGEVDAARKKARDFLDGLRDRVRQPLTDWEAEQARIEEEKRLAEEAEKARIAAEAEAALRERERLVAEREAEIERQRQEQERAQREAAEAFRREREARERAEREAIAAEERRQREAKEAAERAERERIEAEARAHRQVEEAAERERLRAAREAEEREARRLAEEERQRKAEAARAVDKANRERVNAEITAALVVEGIGERVAEKIVQLVAAGSVPHVRIAY